MVILPLLLQIFAQMGLLPPVVLLLLVRLVQMFDLGSGGLLPGHYLLYQNNICLHSLQVR